MSDETDDLIPELFDDEDEHTVSFVPDVSEDKNEAEVKSGGELEELKRQLAEQQAELLRLKSVPPVDPVRVPVQNPVPNIPGNNREALKQQIQNAYLADPAEALISLYEQAKKDAIEEARRNMYPVAGATTRFAIDQFRRSAKLLSDEEEEFEALISQISPQDMANADPTLLGKQLNILKQAAKGAALEKRQARPQPRVPVYSAGGGFPQGGKTPVQVKLTKTQKEFYDIGIDNGLKPTDIMKLIKEEGVQ